MAMKIIAPRGLIFPEGQNRQSSEVRQDKRLASLLLPEVQGPTDGKYWALKQERKGSPLPEIRGRLGTDGWASLGFRCRR